MDTPDELMKNGRAEMLALSMGDFRRYILAEGIVTERDLEIMPDLLCDLFNRADIRAAYEDMAEERYRNFLEDQKLRYAHL